MLAQLAFDAACTGRPPGEVLALSARALAGGRLLAQVGPGNSTFNLATHTLRFAEAPDEAAQLLREGERVMREGGVAAAGLFIEQSWGYWHRDFGSVAVGAARSRLGLDAIRELGLSMTIPALTAVTAENLVHVDRLEEAAAEVDVPVGAAQDTFIEPFALSARGMVRHLLRRHEEAEADLRRVVALTAARGWTTPHVARERLRLAEVLIARDQREEALALAEAELETALRRAQPRRLQARTDTRLLVLVVPAGIERLAALAEPPAPDRDDLDALLSAAGVALLPPSWGATTA